MRRVAFISLISLLSVVSAFAQNLKWEVDEEKSYKIPVGACSWEDILGSDFSGIMIENAIDHILNGEATLELANTLESMPETKFEIEAYFGGWDDMSLQQLVRFYTFVMTMENKYQQPIAYQFYGCNREFNCGCSEEPKSMPYFKLYQIDNGKRTLIGEIVEKPKVSFEDDVLNFIKH